ncbi:SDR family oxidoreductase [Nocardioides hungaricus]
MELHGSAIVTGGASGLGEATARALAARGMTVVIADLQADLGGQVAADIGATYQLTDVTKPEDVIKVVDVASALSELRVVVNCAGIGSPARLIGRDGTLESALDMDRYRRILDINLVGSIDMMRVAATRMSQSEPDDDGCRGVVINTSSIAAQDGQIGQVGYGSSKAALVGATLPAARDLSSAGIRVNTILPGLVDTPIYGTGPSAEEFKAKLAKDVVFPRRLGRASEFASLAVELITNSYINAATVRIDGGLRMAPR